MVQCREIVRDRVKKLIYYCGDFGMNNLSITTRMSFFLNLSEEIISAIESKLEGIAERTETQLFNLTEDQLLDVIKKWGVLSPYERMCLPQIETIFFKCTSEKVCQLIITNCQIEDDMLFKNYTLSGYTWKEQLAQEWFEKSNQYEHSDQYWNKWYKNVL